MRDRLEDQWTLSICELLKKEIDNSKYEVSCFEKVPYSLYVKGYEEDKINLEVMKYEVDLVIKEKRGNDLIPRLIIESKYKSISTHDVITYGNKAKAHKEVFSGLRYGLMVGNSKEKNVPSRLVHHGNEFNFMIMFDSDKPNDKEWNIFVSIVKKKLESANKFENIIRDRRKKDKDRYFCIERDLIFYE